VREASNTTGRRRHHDDDVRLAAKLLRAEVTRNCTSGFLDFLASSTNGSNRPASSNIWWYSSGGAAAAAVRETSRPLDSPPLHSTAHHSRHSTTNVRLATRLAMAVVAPFWIMTLIEFINLMMFGTPPSSMICCCTSSELATLAIVCNAPAISSSSPDSRKSMIILRPPSPRTTWTFSSIEHAMMVMTTMTTMTTMTKTHQYKNVS